MAVFGGIEQYFKPALNKPEACSIRNIDYIYTINLDQRPEKFAYCINQLAPYGILPYRFSAFNGWELTGSELNKLGVVYQPGMIQGLKGTYFLPNGEHVHEIMQCPGRTYFCHRLSKGAIGIVMSHLSVLQDAYDCGYETVWVMEDDIQVIRDPHLLSDYIDMLDSLVGKQGWDILFTDKDTKGQNGSYVICRSHAPRPNFSPSNPAKFRQEPLPIDSHLARIYARYGAYSMVLRRSGMKKILDFFKTYHIFLPYDMDFYLPEDIHLFGVLHDIVSTKPDALSDNGRPNYLDSAAKAK